LKPPNKGRFFNSYCIQMFTQFSELPAANLTILARELGQIWAEGPRIFGDSFHVDPFALDSSTIVGDLHLLQLIERFRVHGPVWNQLYPWGREGHFSVQWGQQPAIGEGDSYRISQIQQIYANLPEDKVAATNFSYTQLLDLVFGLENLASLGLGEDILAKANYEHSVLGNLFQRTLVAASNAGLPVVSMMNLIAANAMVYKEVGKSVGYKAGFKGDWYRPTSEYFGHYDSNGPTYRPNRSLREITALVEAGKIVPTKGATEVACMVAVGLGNIPLHHFGNQNSESLEAFGLLSARYQIWENQMTERNRDRWPLVVDEQGKAINFPTIYARFGRLSVEALLCCLQKGAPLTVQELSQFLTSET
jgi:hypothetical protein